jgi:hypothetical protein
VVSLGEVLKTFVDEAFDGNSVHERDWSMR